MLHDLKKLKQNTYISNLKIGNSKAMKSGWYLEDQTNKQARNDFGQAILTISEPYLDEFSLSFGLPSLILHADGYGDVSGLQPVFIYHLKDHLGNVRIVLQAGGSSGTLKQSNDYYPFGMAFTRNSSFSEEESFARENKYKYNGKEEQPMPGKWLDYGARFYDAQLGRWHSVDPLAEKYSDWSSYAYVMNNPIIYIDPDGREVIFAKGVSDGFKKAFAKSVQHLNKYGAGGMLAKLHSSKKTYYVAEAKGNSSYNTKNNTISWDPTSALLTNELHELSPTTILNHEVDHALQHDQNPEQIVNDGNTPDPDYGNLEEKRVISGSEQSTAKKLGEIKEGEVTRKDHGGTLYETTGPTSTEPKNEIVVKPEK